MMEQIGSKLFSWASLLEPPTRAQAEMTAEMPFVWPHLALMPDAHQGLGATVGSVIPTLGAIMPAAVGVDIGCGMIAARTSLRAGNLEDPFIRRQIREEIERIIPLSAGNYNTKIYSERTMQRVSNLGALPGAHDASMVCDWRFQLGSLGSGNHFIEVSVDELDRVWLFLHSGSRGVGNKLAQKYIAIAKEQCKRRWIRLPHPDLAYLIEGEKEFNDYLLCLNWAQEFARLNREEMLDRVVDAVRAAGPANTWYIEDRIQCHHNYTEQMDGRLLSMYRYPAGAHGHVWLSRKGAIDASEGQLGLIPGSMGTASYVVSGLGNKLSLNSSPHGAGRRLSRTAARKTFSRADLDQEMTGIEWGRSDAFLDEHPDAYKDIGVVMQDAADLVKIENTLHQIINVKGD